MRDPDHRYAMVDNDCDGERDEEGGCERCSEVANAGGSGLDIEFCQIVSADVPHRFWVGSRAEIAWEQDCPGTPWNEPQHEVVFRQAYQLMRFEVTVAQYQTCAAARPGDCPPANRCNPGGGTPNYGVRGKEQQPVVCVDLAMAQGFCRWIGGRLPSEAEWEYGARGPMASADDLVPFPWDEEPPDCARAMYSVCGQQPADVGTHRSGDSPFGLADMAGGVWELTSDGWHENYVGAPGDGSGWPRREGDVRVPIRGASWHSLAPELVTYYRKQWRGDYRASYVGFRCAR